MPQKKQKSYGFKKEKKFYGEKKQPPRDKQQVGIYNQGKGNFGFVDIVEEGVKKWFYVHETKKADAFPGDEVYFYTKVYRNKEEAVITEVKQRAETLVIGRLQMQKTFGFVIPESQYMPADIFVPGKFLNGATDGQRVGVQVIKWKGKNPEGRVVEILPAITEKWGRILWLALEWWARITFPGKVLEEAKNHSGDIDIHKESQRKDLRNMLTFTIDGADSKDLDDALSIQKEKDGGIRLYVHIADVTHYVTENSELDREARKRGTSIYMVNKVVPMLPESLSNGLCSLHPWEFKRTLTCEILVNNSGHIQESKVYESIIESDYRLTYSEVQEILDSIDWPHPNPLLKGEGEATNSEIQLQFWWTSSFELITALKQLSDLKKILSAYKDSKWVLHFDFPETKIEVDENDFPIRFYEYERYESHKIIEECMILANEAIAQQFQKYPFLYRVHETPDEEDVEKYIALLKKFEIDIEVPDISPKSFQKILNTIEWNKKQWALQKMLLRTLMKARYSERNFGHFWLASKFYSHFTSPIRRYPDLQIHRIIKEVIHKDITPERKSHYQEILPKVALRSSEREVLSERIEYKVRDYMAVQYMKDKVWQEFQAKVSGMIEKWFFVELPNTIEWFVEFWLSNLWYDAENFSIFSPISGVELTFWDDVVVTLVRVDEETLRLDFELVISQ